MLAVGGLHVQQFVAGGFDGAGFMGRDVGGRRRDTGFVGSEEGTDGDQVGLRASGKQVHLGFAGPDAIPDEGDGVLGMPVQAIALFSAAD